MQWKTSFSPWRELLAVLRAGTLAIWPKEAAAAAVLHVYVSLFL